MSDLQKNQKRYLDMALEMGADHSTLFRMEDIVFDSRTILKCMFGCDDWGKGHTCPSRPGSLMPWEYRRVFEEYSWGIIVHSTAKKIAQEASLAIERESYLEGYYMSFSLSDCALCGECAGFKDKPCVQPQKARPAFHSVGIDVFATAKRFGLPLKPLREESEEQNWYSAVFVE